MKRKALAWLYNGRIKGQAKYIGKIIKGFACVNKPVLPNAWIEDKTNLQSSRYILRSSERYLLKDSADNVLCFAP